MKKITQAIEYEGNGASLLRNDLKAWHNSHPLKDNGIDWEFQYLWAVMEDHDAFAFILKYPQHSNKFKDV